MLSLIGLSGFILGGILLLTMRKTDRVSDKLGGKVVGIVGRMGSGKTYMAVQIAYSHLAHGHTVATNFTMTVPEGTKGTWLRFEGWGQFAHLQNCVVVIDEAQLYAPSYKPIAFPLVARWKLAMARKFKLDVYWISQHEDRVNSTLKALTNVIYVCQAWMGAKWFTARGYEPEYVRKKNRHLQRRSYKFKLEVAQMYDTLEVLNPDDHLREGDEMTEIALMAGAEYNANRQASKAASGKKKGGSYGPCTGTTLKGTPCSRNAVSDSGLCAYCEKRGQSVESILEAAMASGLEPKGGADSPPAPRAPGERCPHEVARGRKAGLCRRCPVAEGTCTGMTEGGATCGEPTTAANGLCDECVQRARASLQRLAS